MSNKKKLLFTGGGSGGHITPLLAVAEEIGDRAEILYLGSSGMERELAARAGLKFKTILAGKIRRYLNIIAFFENIIDLAKIILGFFQAFLAILFYWPEAIFAKGGYVSLPVIIAGKILGRKIYLHESDIIPGLTNRIAARFAKKIFTAFPIENYSFDRSKMICTGIPIKSDFFEAKTVADYQSFDLDPRKITLLITGGSQGSTFLNHLILTNLAVLAENYQLIHFCGKKDYQSLLEAAKGVNNYHVYEFSGSMAAAIRASDLVISRASATTLFEIFASGRPSFLIPLKYAAANHQLANAEYVKAKGAADYATEDSLTPEKFMELIDALLTDKEKLVKMSAASLALAQPDCTKIITAEILNEN